jgi:hypothetical protein
MLNVGQHLAAHEDSSVTADGWTRGRLVAAVLN